MPTLVPQVVIALWQAKKRQKPGKVIEIGKSFYSVRTLRQELRSFERRYGMSSRDFFDAYLANAVPDEIKRFDRIVWADLYRETDRLAQATPQRRARRNPSALQPVG